ncbi:MAG: peptidoglycan DD-metalloendopeptidase family protein [bacterium]|nr:peptidoglycan DD-metalloendopeptidase family protein [bacterium]
MPPVGIKNNNYLNVKNGPDPWMDAHGKPSRTDARGHAVFADPAYGVRAGLRQLRTYFVKHRCRTVLAILSRWAPASDTIGSLPGNPHNNPSQYAVFVSNRMGIAIDQPLELFDEDGNVDDVGQLRRLFAAMAAYEIGGGFEVPEAELTAGLALVDPGAGKTASGPAPAPLADAHDWRIGGSVGRADRAKNDPTDVETVQSMLRSAAMILGDARFDPGSIDGSIAAKSAKSNTVQAIVALQERFMSKPDGVMEPGGRTWQELVRIVGGGVVASGAAAASTGRECFPLAAIPAADWTKDARRFGAARSRDRVHAGSDLYAPAGSTIYAVMDGTVVRGPYAFYAGTFALEIDHGSVLARYGEIQQDTMVRQNDRVVAGQPIARVGHLVGISVPSDMLHLELYDKTAHGPLTVPKASSAIAPDGRAYMRRKDLTNPEPYLERWHRHLPVTAAPVAIPPAAAAGRSADASTPAPPSIPGTGFCLHIRRRREEERTGMGYARTVGDYQCFWNGEPIHDLEGQMVERGGPGDNTPLGVSSHRRIAAGRYPIVIHAGTKYRTYRYAAAGSPLPGLGLIDTGVRTAILVHPAHHAHGYLSSIGCLNPAVGLRDADSRIALDDSRNRVIALIEGMKAKLGDRFPRSGSVPDAVVVIEGEP